MIDDRLPRAAPAEWTPQQIENANRYGVCLFDGCGLPRELYREEREEREEDGRKHYTIGMMCARGHRHW